MWNREGRAAQGNRIMKFYNKDADNNRQNVQARYFLFSPGLLYPDYSFLCVSITLVTFYRPDYHYLFLTRTLLGHFPSQKDFNAVALGREGESQQFKVSRKNPRIFTD